MKRIPALRPRALEAALYRRGFERRDVRGLVILQLGIALAGTLAATMACLPLGAMAWAGAFAAGAAIASLNFYHLAGFAQKALRMERGAVTEQLLRFYLRLVLTGVALYLLVVPMAAPVTGLLAGLSSVVATGVVFGLSRLASEGAAA
jgi:hypothetical protein